MIQPSAHRSPKLLLSLRQKSMPKRANGIHSSVKLAPNHCVHVSMALYRFSRISVSHPLLHGFTKANGVKRTPDSRSLPCLLCSTYLGGKPTQKPRALGPRVCGPSSGPLLNQGHVPQLRTRDQAPGQVNHAAADNMLIRSMNKDLIRVIGLPFLYSPRTRSVIYFWQFPGQALEDPDREG